MSVTEGIGRGYLLVGLGVSMTGCFLYSVFMIDYVGKGWKASLETEYPTLQLLFVGMHTFHLLDFFDFYCT